MNPLTLAEAFTTPAFLTGLGLGVLASLAAWGHRRTDVWLASTGVAAAIALLLNERVLALPTPPLALAALAGVAVLVGALGAWRLAQEAGPVPVGLCLALTALGVWGTVPDTENAVVLLGACLGGILGAWRMAGARGSVVVGAALALSVAAFIAVTEGLGRVSAPIGALAVFGVFLIAPLGPRLLREVPAWALVAAHVALVIVCGRVAGQASGAGAAAGIAAVALAVAAGVLATFSRWNRQRQEGRQRR